MKLILEEDSKQEQPLFLKISDNLIMNIARKVVQEKKRTFLIGITGESASGKTVFVDNTIKACVKDRTEGIYPYYGASGIVDYPTWYKISEIYVAVSRIAELY